MSRLLLTTAIALLIGLPLCKCRAEDGDKTAKDIPKVKPNQLVCKLLIKKKRRKDIAGDFDDMVEYLYYRPSIINRSLIDIDGYKLTLHLIGQSVLDKKVFSILEVSSYPLSLKSKKEFCPNEKLLPNKYDDKNSYKTGYKYYTYVMVIKDKKGEVVLVKCPKTKFNKFMDSLIKLPKDKQFDDKGRVLKL